MRATILHLIALAALLVTNSAHAAQQVTFYHHDALGSVIAKSNEQGQLYLNEEYQPYGAKVYGTVDTLGDSEDWYTGKNYSDELDLTYFGARWYDAKQGRFLSVDPVGASIEKIHLVGRYHYANNNPYKYVDPDGRTPRSIFGGTPGAATAFAGKVRATAQRIAFIQRMIEKHPKIKEILASNKPALEKRGYRPDPGERTFQGQVDAVTKSGNPTIRRGGQDLFRLRSSGHGQSGATATPQNIYRTNPRTGERFGPQSGPDRAVTNRDIRELYKAQTNQGTNSIRTRSGGS